METERNNLHVTHGTETHGIEQRLYCAECMKADREFEKARNDGTLDAILRDGKEPWEDRFDRRCHLTIDGKCKYFRPEAFGYDPDDTDYWNDKFFPEKIREIIRSERLIAQKLLLEAILAKKRETMIVGNTLSFADILSAASDLGL